MARQTQAKWFADALLSNAAGYRSFEAVNLPAGPAYSPGQVLTAALVPPVAAGTGARYVLLQAAPVRTAPMPVLILARDAEVNDAYLIYAGATGAGIAEVDRLLGLDSNIIVRRGVMATSIVSPSVAESEAGTEAAGGPPEPVAA